MMSQNADLRVEVDVEQDDGVRAGQIQPLAASARAQQERKHARARAVEPAQVGLWEPWSGSL